MGTHSDMQLLGFASEHQTPLQQLSVWLRTKLMSSCLSKAWKYSTSCLYIYVFKVMNVNTYPVPWTQLRSHLQSLGSSDAQEGG